jgi:hypothetical protein
MQSISIRFATDDAPGLARVAQRDTRRLPARPHLVAEALLHRARLGDDDAAAGAGLIIEGIDNPMFRDAAEREERATAPAA